MAGSVQPRHVVVIQEDTDNNDDGGWGWMATTTQLCRHGLVVSGRGRPECGGLVVVIRQGMGSGCRM